MAFTGPPDHVLVIGPGAIGGVVAGRLANKGLDVTVATRTAKSAELFSDQGVRAEGPDGRAVHGEVRAVCVPEELTDQPDLVVLATKCQDAPEALSDWHSAVPDDCPIITMQNGIMGDTLGPIAGEHRHVECVVAFAASLPQKGHSVQTGPGNFILGEWPDTQGAIPDRVLDAARRLEYVAPVHTTTNMLGAKWTKVIINSAITTLGVATDSTLGDLMEHRRARDAFLAVATEGQRVGAAAGVEFEPIQNFRPGLVALPDDPGRFSVWWRDVMLRLIGRKHARHRSSSLQSLERGRRTEVDYLNGLIVEVGAKHDIDTPVNEALVEIVHDIEAGDREPDMSNLDALPLAV